MKILDPGTPLPTIDSTQTACLEAASAGAPEGTVVWALEQTAGRGRGDHSWDSAKGKGAWISFVLRPKRPAAEWPQLTAVVAVAAAQSMEELGAGPVAIKWPNDLIGRLGKLGGVLAETCGSAVVIGLGVNLTHTWDDFSEVLRGTASSLALEGGREITPREWIDAFDGNFARLYESFQEGGLASSGRLREELIERFHLKDRDVTITSQSRSVHGKAVDIGPEGELVLETEDGRQRIFGGEVTA